MHKQSVKLPPFIAQLFDKPGAEWSPAKRDRVREWLEEDRQAKRLEYTATQHLRLPKSMEATDIAAQVVRDYLSTSLDGVCDSYNPFPAEFKVGDVRDFGRLLDTLHQAPDALAAFLKEHLHVKTTEFLAQWPLLHDAVVADLHQALDEPSLYSPERFAKVKLHDETRQFLIHQPLATDARRLNLMLLGDAYPRIFSHAATELKVKDFGRLLDKLHRPPKAEALAAFLKEHLHVKTAALLTQWPPLRDAVVADLNQVLDEPSLYTEERFATVQLQDKTRQFLLEHKTDADPSRLNRMLLTDAYRQCLKPARHFWSYLLFCFERHCHQFNPHIEIPVTRVDGRGTDGERTGQFAAPGDNIHMHPERAAELMRFITKFGDALEQLTLQDRRRILMHYFRRMSLARCAEVLGISETNAKVRLFHARLRLGRILRDDPYVQKLLEDRAYFLEISHYWQPFSASILERFASDLDFLQDVAEDEASEDEQDEDVV